MGLWQFIEGLFARWLKSPAQVEAMPLSTFYLFPKLPLKFRREI
jgi:hypothetical protein